MTTSRADAVIIGGGAAGMMASAVAAERGLSVVLLEPNRELGRKLCITGKGRCNVTNNCTVREFMENVPRNQKFLSSALSRFSPTDTMAMFESLGVPLKTERGARVFPVSDSAADIAQALEKYMRRGGVRVLRTAARGILTQGGAVSAVRTAEGDIPCASALLCTGGASYPGTGSNGDGYAFAKALGHTVLPPKPSLVPLVSGDDFCRELQGLSLKNVRLTALEDGKRIYSELGELLFTHFGVSGPLVLSASAHMRNFDERRYSLSIDLKPGLEPEKLDERLLRDFSENLNRDFGNSLGGLLPRLMIPVVIARCGIPADTKINSVTRKQRRALAELLKNFTVSVTGPRPVAEAIVTSGGVDVREVDPRTMQSKLLPGLYFAGELLDTDAYTGGFNLQIAWSTGHAAGMSMKGDSHDE